MADAKRKTVLRRVFKGLTAAVLGGTAFGGMSAAGYTPGVETDIGVDASVVRDTVTGALAIGGLFLPQLATVANVIKSLTNHGEVQKVSNDTNAQFVKLEELEERVAALEDAAPKSWGL